MNAARSSERPPSSGGKATRPFGFVLRLAQDRELVERPVEWQMMS
jgi:hypothetical protein